MKPPPTILPRVAILIFRTAFAVFSPSSNCGLVMSSAALGRAFVNMPAGMKNIFATLCSKPMATKAMIGKKMPKILPTMSFAASASTIARQTSQLQRMARKKIAEEGSAHFAVAI